MTNYKELIEELKNTRHLDPLREVCADAIEQLMRDINYCPTDTLRKYHAWLLEQFHNNPTSEILNSIDTAIGWLKAYAEYRDINVSFGVENAVDWNGIK